jgi:hypothetical protein
MRLGVFVLSAVKPVIWNLIACVLRVIGIIVLSGLGGCRFIGRNSRLVICRCFVRNVMLGKVQMIIEFVSLDMIRVCAWCHPAGFSLAAHGLPQHLRITHGLCPECLTRQKAEIARFVLQSKRSSKVSISEP